MKGAEPPGVNAHVGATHAANLRADIRARHRGAFLGLRKAPNLTRLSIRSPRRSIGIRLFRASLRHSPMPVLVHFSSRALIMAIASAAAVALSSCSSLAPRSDPLSRASLYRANDEAFAAPLSLETLDVERLGAALFHETNRVRREHGLPLFRGLAKLDQAADLQAGAAALKRTADHTHILPPLATPADRIRHVKLQLGAVGENAALLPFVDVPPAHGISLAVKNGSASYFDGLTGEPAKPHTYASFAATALEAWLSSPPHRAGLLNPVFRYVGCSARPTRQISGAEMIACIQVFYAP